MTKREFTFFFDSSSFNLDDLISNQFLSKQTFADIIDFLCSLPYLEEHIKVVSTTNWHLPWSLAICFYRD